MSKTKIEWCDSTWNPVWGCTNNCPFCYAKKIAKRFYKTIYNKEVITQYHRPEDLLKCLESFTPTFLHSQLYKEFKNNEIVFVNSMSDIGQWQLNWIHMVLEVIEQNNETKFVFLTKNIFNPIYDYMMGVGNWKIKNCNIENIYFGFTATKQEDIHTIYTLLESRKRVIKNLNIVLNIEPILEEIFLVWLEEYFRDGIIKQVIIGAETGNRKCKIIPKTQWIVMLSQFVALWNEYHTWHNKRHYTKLFMKDNLKAVWGRELIQERII